MKSQKIVVALIAAFLITAIIFLAPGFFIEHFSVYFDGWFRSLSPEDKKLVATVGRFGSPAIGVTLAFVGAAVQAKRKKDKDADEI